MTISDLPKRPKQPFAFCLLLYGILSKVCGALAKAFEAYVNHPDSLYDSSNRFAVGTGAIVVLTATPSWVLFCVEPDSFFFGQFFICAIGTGLFVMLQPAILRTAYPNMTPNTFAVAVPTLLINFVLPLLFWWLIGPIVPIIMYILLISGATLAFCPSNRPVYMAAIVLTAASTFLVSVFWHPDPIMVIPAEKETFAGAIMHGYLILLMFSIIVVNGFAFKATAAELQETRRKLMDQRDRARDAAKAREQFLAMISHEFRTPLTTLMATSQMLRNRPDAKPLANELGAIETASHVLLRFFENALDTVQYGRSNFNPDPVILNLNDLMEDVIGVLSPQIAAKDLCIDTRLPDASSANCRSDPSLLRQLFTNLVGNAVKFTERGRVLISVDFYDLHGSTRLRSEISDTGHGISPKDQESIFDLFDRGSFRTANATEGSGLGLAVCKQIVKALGGEIGVRSTLGQGSTFWFDIPITRLQKPDSPQPEHVPPAGLSILLVEDHEFNRQVMIEQFEQIGHQVVSVTNCDEAVAIAKARRFDIIVTDYYLADSIGTDIAQQVRQFDSNIPIIVVTATTKEGLTEECRSAGVNTVVPKPLTMETFQELCSQILKRN